MNAKQLKKAWLIGAVLTIFPGLPLGYVIAFLLPQEWTNFVVIELSLLALTLTCLTAYGAARAEGAKK